MSGRGHEFCHTGINLGHPVRISFFHFGTYPKRVTWFVNRVDEDTDFKQTKTGNENLSIQLFWESWILGVCNQ